MLVFYEVVMIESLLVCSVYCGCYGMNKSTKGDTPKYFTIIHKLWDLTPLVLKYNRTKDVLVVRG